MRAPVAAFCEHISHVVCGGKRKADSAREGASERGKE